MVDLFLKELLAGNEDTWKTLERLLVKETFAAIQAQYLAGNHAEVQRLLDNVNFAALDDMEKDVE